MRTLLRGGRVFDGERLTGATTVVLDDSVIGIGEGADEVVDLDGATLLPGLIDAHQHLVFNGVGSFEEQVSPHTDAELRERAHRNARKALAAGITTLRDLGDRGYVTLDLRGLDDVGTILAAGPPLTRVRGHCWYLGGEADGEDALRAAVRERAARGCDVVKIMVTGGHGTPGYPMWASQYTTAEVAAVVDEAGRVDLPVAAHCHGLDGIESALAAGVASIEHCTFISDEARARPTPDLLDRLAGSGIGLSISIGSLDMSAAPPFVVDNLRTLMGAAAGLLQRGARLCVGTDAGIAPSKPHDVLPTALRALTDEGVEPAVGLRALTATAAEVVGLGDQKGRLRPGFDADVLAADGDPLTDPEALLRPVAVWHRGRRVV
ncbi:MAG TPA: amidohydrolase family protein [Acidimicrobiales bacterium]|nr:amidohydrolase family protein [Acidimicrobiales bacterium]